MPAGEEVLLSRVASNEGAARQIHVGAHIPLAEAMFPRNLLDPISLERLALLAASALELALATGSLPARCLPPAGHGLLPDERKQKMHDVVRHSTSKPELQASKCGRTRTQAAPSRVESTIAEEEERYN